MEGVPVWIFYCAAGVIGLELGGLASIFIQRWIDELPICTPGRSRCPACEQKLSWRDTIPVVSYFLLRGRCRHCGASIGSQYVLVEISCMAWSLAVAYGFGPSAEWAAYLILGTMLIAGSFIDFETFLLPDRITLGGTGLALGASLFLAEGPTIQDALLGAGVGGGLFWLVQRGYRLVRDQEGLGTGDVKLMCMIGGMTGLTGLPFTILAAALTGGGASVFYMLKPSGKGLQTRIPFGPFLSLGCMVYILYGPSIIRWFASL